MNIDSPTRPTTQPQSQPRPTRLPVGQTRSTTTGTPRTRRRVDTQRTPGKTPASSQARPRIQKPTPAKEGELRFLALGGCGEVTRSMYVYEYADDIVIVDMGVQW